MTIDPSRTAEIERDAAWLAEIPLTDPPAPLERVKHRTRIEVNQRWLEHRLAGDPSIGDLARIRHTVRAAAAQGAEDDSRVERGWLGRFRYAGWAAAAVLLLTVGLASYYAGKPVGGGTDPVAGLDRWVDAMSLDEAGGDLSTVLSELGDEVATLEASLAEGETPSFAAWDLDDLGDDVEVLVTGIG